VRLELYRTRNSLDKCRIQKGEIREELKALKHQYQKVLAELKREQLEVGHLRREMQECYVLYEQAQVDRDENLRQLNIALKELQHERSKRGGRSNKMNEELKCTVIKKTKNMLFNFVKFVEGDEELDEAVSFLLEHGNLPEENTKTPEAREDFSERYRIVVKKALFERRNYVSQELKKEIFRQSANKGHIPTLEELVKCLERKIVTEDDKKVFEFYWDKLLPREAGALQVWNVENRYYNTICGAVRKDTNNRKLPMITPDDEAFLVLSLHNALDRWIAEAAEMESQSPASANSKVSNKKGKVPNGVFTKSDSGQNEWGGWTDEGLEKFTHYRDLNTKARKDPNTRALEEETLQSLRIKKKIVCVDSTEQSKADKSRKRRKKRGDGSDDSPPVRKKKVRTLRLLNLNYDDDDDDDEDDGRVGAGRSLAV
jgi:hypothetical protein